ncbi:MAG: polysaccharide biosynthesis/export family protein [Gammaproteobacteria bacterium]|nr:polysaccharide biosynthesis/export family protein [Gammaproteobacteria bacterium]
MILNTRLSGLICQGLALLLMAVSISAVAQEAAENQASPGEPAAYTVNPGDILTISVWKEPDLIRQVIIRPDGAFSFPLVGDIQARGRSIEDIQELLKQRLERYIPDPVVTVTVDQILGHSVYVLGQVNRPGQFVAAANIDVMQALALAGGTSVFANLDKIKILRRVNKNLIAIPFDYSDIEKGKRLNQNILLRPGDVVVVP